MRITDDNFTQEMKKGNEKALEYVIENYGWVIKTVLKKHLFYLQNHYDECMNDCLVAIWKRKKLKMNLTKTRKRNSLLKSLDP